MTDSPKIIRVLSNNAVLARANDDEMVLVGRGIGFSRHPGDLIDYDNVQHRFVEVSPDRAAFLNAPALSPVTLTTINAAVELASDLLGDLHPSVYLLLADHLAFAVQRVGQGELIESSLLQEIKAVFPAEFAAAELVVSYINSHLDISLPVDEAAFITLHLNAALTGDTVKAPLQQANLLSELVSYVETESGKNGHDDEELISSLMRVAKRMRSGVYRRNDATQVINRQIPREVDMARSVISRIIDGPIPKSADGEVAYFALVLHGWLDSTN